MPAAPMQRSLMMYAAADIVMEKIRAATPYHSLEAVQHIGARYPVIFWPCVSFQRQVSLAPTRQHSTPLVQAARPARRSNACHISATRTRVCHRHCMNAFVLFGAGSAQVLGSEGVECLPSIASVRAVSGPLRQASCGGGNGSCYSAGKLARACTAIPIRYALFNHPTCWNSWRQ